MFNQDLLIMGNMPNMCIFPNNYIFAKSIKHYPLYSPRANNLSNCDNGNARQVGRP